MLDEFKAHVKIHKDKAEPDYVHLELNRKVKRYNCMAKVSNHYRINSSQSPY